jgi:hypothetical protein
VKQACTLYLLSTDAFVVLRHGADLPSTKNAKNFKDKGQSPVNESCLSPVSNFPEPLSMRTPAWLLLNHTLKPFGNFLPQTNSQK